MERYIISVEILNYSSYVLYNLLIKFSTVDQNVGISLKCILSKFELSTSGCFQDIAVQSYQFSSKFSVAIFVTKDFVASS